MHTTADGRKNQRPVAIEIGLREGIWLKPINAKSPDEDLHRCIRLNKEVKEKKRKEIQSKCLSTATAESKTGTKE
jgi:hypothetical protein